MPSVSVRSSSGIRSLLSSFKRVFPYQELPIKKDTERREHEMNNELMERILQFNCKAEKAENCGARVTSGGDS